MEEDIRWEQRFSNFNKAFKKLEEAILFSKKDELSELEMEGLIQRFEYTYELAWKTLQDYLKSSGYEGIFGPSQVLNQALQIGLIENPEAWRRLKKSRELTSHTYNSQMAKEISSSIIKEYNELFQFLQKQLETLRSGKTGNLFI